eukprot:11117549-Ditylum_brightwellii.AAC.1
MASARTQMQLGWTDSWISYGHSMARSATYLCVCALGAACATRHCLPLLLPSFGMRSLRSTTNALISQAGHAALPGALAVGAMAALVLQSTDWGA